MYKYTTLDNGLVAAEENEANRALSQGLKVR